MRDKFKDAPRERLRFGIQIEVRDCPDWGSDRGARYEVASLLEQVAGQLMGMSTGGILRDHIGRKIGTWGYEHHYGNKVNGRDRPAPRTVQRGGGRVDVSDNDTVA